MGGSRSDSQSLSTAPGSSLVSVCQRSILLSLFFRQSNQCFRRSPLALMPSTTPPVEEARGAAGDAVTLSGPSLRPSCGWTASGFQPYPAHLTRCLMSSYSSSARDQSSVGQGATTHIRDGKGKGGLQWPTVHPPETRALSPASGADRHHSSPPPIAVSPSQGPFPLWARLLSRVQSEVPCTRGEWFLYPYLPRTGTRLNSISLVFLTDEIIGFANVIIPDSDLQGLLGQVSVLDLITELLLARRGC